MTKTWVARAVWFIVNPKIIKPSSFCVQQRPFMQERNVTGSCTSAVCNFIINILIHFMLSICGSLLGCWEGTGTLGVIRPACFTILGHEQECWRTTTLNEHVLILSTIIYFYLLKCQYPIQWVWGRNKWSYTSSPHICLPGMYRNCIWTALLFSPYWNVWTNWAFFKLFRNIIPAANYFGIWINMDVSTWFLNIE